MAEPDIGRPPWNPCDGATDGETLHVHDLRLVGTFTVAGQAWLYETVDHPDQPDRWWISRLDHEIPDEFSDAWSVGDWARSTARDSVEQWAVTTDDQCRIVGAAKVVGSGG